MGFNSGFKGLKGDSDYDITLSDNYCHSLHTGQLRYIHDHSPLHSPLLTDECMSHLAVAVTISYDTCTQYNHHKKCDVNSTNNLHIC